MNRLNSIALLCFGCLALAPLAGQAPPAEPAKPAAPAPSSANPFPEDTSTVPVLPAKDSAAPSEEIDSGGIPLPGQDLDPVRSPDDPEPAASGTQQQWSSSLKGVENLLPKPNDDQPENKKKKLLVIKQQTQQEAAAKDLQIGSYYLQIKDWKGALSRFESALVLAPDNPDVYWGLAESSRHLGQLADARANYQKVAEYDPGSRHGKDAQKALKQPEIANGKNTTLTPPPPVAPKFGSSLR